MNEEVALLREKYPLLTEKEATELRFVVRAQQPALSKALADQLSNLFLRGLTCTEIQRSNPTLSLGQIVRARVDNGWDKGRESYLQDLFSTARENTQQVALEGAQFLNSQLAAYHKLHGERFQKYLQTGNVEDLGESIILLTPQGYKNAVDLLMKVTGQDKVQKIVGKVEHVVSTEVKVATDRPMTGTEAKGVFKSMIAGHKVTGEDDEE